MCIITDLAKDTGGWNGAELFAVTQRLFYREGRSFQAPFQAAAGTLQRFS